MTSRKDWGRRASLNWFRRSVAARDISGHTAGGHRMARKRLTRTTGHGNYLEATWSCDNEGRMTSVTYPATSEGPGPAFTYTFDAMGRPVKLTDNQAEPREWVKDMVYNAARQITAMKYWNGIAYWGNYYIETRTYNARSQLTRLTVSNATDLQYNYSDMQNNGRITSRKDWVSGEEGVYQYDALQRLISAETVGPEWGQSFAYDGFGNLLSQTVTKGSAPSLSVTVNGASNRITTAGYRYDANGRQKPPLCQGCPPPEVTYFYGVDGTRMGTYSGGSGGPFGGTWDNINVYFAGKLVWREYSNGASAGGAVVDRLGSVVAGALTSRYYPYGEEFSTTQQDRTKFATYYRDETTTLDYANQRYYGRTIGRFLTADPFGGSANPADPQSWNRYSYVENDPVNLVDPLGLQISAESLDFIKRCLSAIPIGGPYVIPPGCLVSDDFFESPSNWERAARNAARVARFSGSATVTKGDVTAHNITQDGPKWDEVKASFQTVVERLKRDLDCWNWLGEGVTGARVRDPKLLGDTLNRIGVASRIELNGNSQPGIAAIANLSQAWDVVINGAGAFFYGGDIPGIPSSISGKSENGRVFILIHELAHIATAAISHNDVSDSVNAANNGIIWKNCEKAIMGR